MKWILVLLGLICGTAHAQTVVGPCMQQAVGGCTLIGPLGVTGAAAFSFPGTALTLPTGSNASIGGTLGVTGGLTLTNPTSVPTLTISGNARTMTTADPVGFTSLTGFVGGSLAAQAYFNYASIDDKVLNPSNVTYGWNFTDVVAPNGNSASGPRVGLAVQVQMVGSLQSGSITNSGISSAIVASVANESNLGGTSTFYQGSLNGFNSVCEIGTGTSFIAGCSGIEIDDFIGSGLSLQQNTLLLMVQGSDSEGTLGPDLGVVWAAQPSKTNQLVTLMQSGGNLGSEPLAPYGGIFYFALPIQAPNNSIGYGFDTAQATFKSFSNRTPYNETVPLQATAITAAARLTSDGALPASWIQAVQLTSGGSANTSQPTATITGCSGSGQVAAINTQLGLGNILGLAGVYNNGNTCAPQGATTVAFSGGGGSGATANVLVNGNTLNLPINSTNDIVCHITGQDTGSDYGGWTIEFGATVGAAAANVAIVGSPTWTKVFPSGSVSNITVGAPAADTTYGGINITVTPSGSTTWNFGGQCDIHSTAQVI